MGWSFPIGRLLGSELRVHATFFLLIGWIGLSAWAAAGPAAAAISVLFVLTLFACVVAHEYGHALMARRYGVETPDITLLPIGGLARLTRMPEKPGQEIAVALAGPAVNIVIWAVLATVFGTGLGDLTEVSGSVTDFARRIAALNLFLAVFNLIPAFPMDGGRVLRAALATRLDRGRATRIAAAAGQVAAFAFGLLGLTSGNVILILIAVFIWFAAAAERNDAALHDVATGLRARDAMITAFEPLDPDDTLQAANAALIRTTQHEFPVLDADGRLAGFLTRQALFRAMAEENRQARVGALMVTDIPTCAHDAPLDDVLSALRAGDVPAVGVTGRDGRLLGYVTVENLGELMMVRRRKV